MEWQIYTASGSQASKSCALAWIQICSQLSNPPVKNNPSKFYFVRLIFQRVKWFGGSILASDRGVSLHKFTGFVPGENEYARRMYVREQTGPREFRVYSVFPFLSISHPGCDVRFRGWKKNFFPPFSFDTFVSSRQTSPCTLAAAPSSQIQLCLHVP